MVEFYRIKSHEKFAPEPYEGEPGIRSATIADVLAALGHRDAFDDARQVWMKLNVRPETIESFRDLIGADAYRSLIFATVALAKRGYLEGREEEAIAILKRIAHEQVGDDWYKLSDASRPSRTGLPGCELNAVPWNKFGLRLFKDLQAFLRSNVTDNTYQPLCYDDARKPFYDVKLPEKVTVVEGETVKIPVEVDTNVITDGKVELRWRPVDAHEFASVDVVRNGYSVSYSKYPYELRKTELSKKDDRTMKETIRIRAEDRTSDHLQPEFPVVITVDPSFAPELKSWKDIHVTIDNRNEPPKVGISVPTHVAEGEEVCFKPSVEDPEGDPLIHRWIVKGGNAVFSQPNDGSRRLCAKLPVTGRFELPIDVELVAEDVVIERAKYPGLASAETHASARVYIDPMIALPTGEKTRPDARVVETMSNPDIKKLAVAPLATDSSIYIFLRLPEALEEFRPVVESNIGRRIAVDSKDIDAYSYRHWSPFRSAPSATHVAVSSSPLRKWTRGASYKNDLGRVFVSEAHGTSRFSVPIKGEVVIPPPKIGTVAKMESESSWEKGFVYHLRFTNAIDEDGKPFFKPADKIPVTVSVKQRTDLGKVSLWRRVEGVRKSPEGSNELVYEIAFDLPEAYAARATVHLETKLQNRYDETAVLDYEAKTPPSNRRSIFDGIGVELEPGQMPLPWYLVTLRHKFDSAEMSSSLFLSSLRPDLAICPTGEARHFIKDCSRLNFKTSWAEATEGKILLPLKVDDGFDEKLAAAYRAVGGRVGGTLDLNLGPWVAEIEIPYVALEAPKDPTIAIDWGDLLKKIPQYVLGGLLALADRLSKRLSDTVSDRISTRGPAAGRTLVRSGDTFWVDMDLALKEEGEGKFVGLTKGSTDKYADSVEIYMRPKDSGRSDIYALKPLEIAKAGQDAKGKVAAGFRLPDYLPRGEYRGILKVTKNIYADYELTYTVSFGPSRKEWNKVLPVSVFDYGTSVELNDLHFEGNSKIDPPSARGLKQQ